MADPITLPPGFEVVHDESPSKPGAIALPPGFEVVKDDKHRGVDLDLLSEAGTNFLPSLTKNVGQMVEGIGTAITSPVQTAKTLGKLALTASPMAEPVVGYIVKNLAPHLDEDQKKKLASQLGELYGPKHALVQDYVEAYGGPQELLKMIGTDPVRVMSDLAMIATGGELALAKAPGIAGKVGKVAKAATYLDPLTATGAALGSSLKKVPQFFDSAANVGEGPMYEALRSGFRGGQTGVDFRRAIRGDVPAEDVINTAKQGVQSLRDDMYSAYQTEKANWAGAQPNLGFDKIDQAELKVHNLISSQPGSTLRFKVSDADKNKISTLTEIVDEWRKDPTSWTIEGLDDLKQRLRNEVDWKADKPVFQRAVTTLVNGVREQLTQNAPPSYKRAMRAYTEASTEIDNIEKAFSLGKNAQMQTAMSKLQSLMRNNASTQYGLRGQLFDRLEQKSGIELRPTLAGHALSADAPRGIARGTMSGALPYAGSMMFGASALDPVTLALGAAGYGLGRVATSPRTMGNIMYGAGAAARPAGRAWSKLNPTTQSILRAAVSQPARNAYGAFDRSMEDPFGSYAAGGYFSGRR